MDKQLKIGLYCMASAVLLMPLAILFKNEYQNYVLAVLVMTMALELIGLIFVILHILKKRKSNVHHHD